VRRKLVKAVKVKMMRPLGSKTLRVVTLNAAMANAASQLIKSVSVAHGRHDQKEVMGV
jgi:hypothetical protein